MADPISPYLYANIVFNQTSNTSPVASSFDFFSIGATFLTAGDYTSATATYPGFGSPQILSLIAPTRFDFGSPAFTSFSALQTAYPFGTYTVTATGNQTTSSSVSYQANYFPSSIPFITNYSSLNGLNPAKDFTVQYNSFTPNVSVTTGFTFLTIWTADTHQVVFQDDFQSPSSTQALIPAGTLAPKTTYTFELDFSDRLIVGSTTQGFDNRTDGSFTTGPTPPVAPVLGKQDLVAGFDTYAYPGDSVMASLKSNFSWVGYYLAPAPSRSNASWMGHEAALVSQGWIIAPIYIGEQDPTKPNDGLSSYHPSASKGTTDGNSAVGLLTSEHFTPGTIVYLDIETAGPQSASELAYIQSWCSAVATGGYTPGIYCLESAQGSIASVEPNLSYWVANPIKSSSALTGPKIPNPSGSGDPSATAWQYKQNTSIPIPGGQLNVDLDTVSVSRLIQAMSAFGATSAAPALSSPISTQATSSQDFLALTNPPVV